jgi:hypothetical protein
MIHSKEVSFKVNYKRFLMQNISISTSILMLSSLFFFAFSDLITAKDFYVNSESTFNSAQASANAGDVIIWLKGTYPDIVINVSTSEIVLRAESSGAVIFNGNSMCEISGNSITFDGFQYIGGDIGGNNEVLAISGNQNKIINCNFSGIIAHKYITIWAGTQYNELSYCNIENKPVSAPIGCTIQISTSPTVPGYHKIRYCSFQNFPGNGGDFGNEPIRIGLGAESLNTSRTLIEYCYFNNVGPGDSESISVKCCENVIRYCTFDYNPEGMLVFRIGNRNIAYSNFFMHGSGGIRVKETNDIYCYNNYFETSGASGDMEAIRFDYVSPNLNNINFMFNTFVECGNIDLGGSGPISVTFANNIFKKASGNIFTNPNGQTSWAGNIYLGNLGISIPSGMQNADPHLTLNTDGYYGLSSGSPAIDAASPDYPMPLDITNINDDPAILFDISGQPRSPLATQKDVGCDEYTTGAITIRPLKLSDVGPSYLHSTFVESDGTNPLSFRLFQNFPNPFNPSTVIKYELSNPGNVQLKVYNLQGKEIVTLVTEYQKSGYHTISFMPGNLRLSSGIYYYRLLIGGASKCMRMVYLK